MESVTSFLENVPQPVQLALAGIGALYLGSKFLGYLQLVLNSFLLPGTNVRATAPPTIYSVGLEFSGY